LLLLLCLTRPSGILYLPVAAVWLFILSSQNTIRKWTITLVIITASCWLLNTALGSGGELDFMLPFREEHIICGAPTLLHPADIHTVQQGNSIYGLFYYITHNFPQFIRLAALKSL